jgi:hypothetical protein
MRIAMIPAIAACTAALIATASPARAGDQSYINELRADGVFMINENFWIINGHRMCGMLHDGVAPEILYNQFGLQNAQGPQIVGAAQHKLCPDTLH